MQTMIYIRPGREDEPSFGEDLVAARHFQVATSLEQIQPGRRVIGRYSLYPFYEEVEREIAARGSQLVNSFAQHRFATDLGQWLEALSGETFPTWSALEQVPDGIPLVVKGETNGRKHTWSESFFAPDKEAARCIALKLESDPLLAAQQLYFRAYTPLREFVASDGQRPPIVEEYRFLRPRRAGCRSRLLLERLPGEAARDGCQPRPWAGAGRVPRAGSEADRAADSVLRG